MFARGEGVEVVALAPVWRAGRLALAGLAAAAARFKSYGWPLPTSGQPRLSP